MNRPTRGYWCECWTQDLTTTEAPMLRRLLGIPGQLSYNLLYGFKARARRGRAASAARPASCLRPGWPRPAARCMHVCGQRQENPLWLGPVGSTALGSQFGASLEDHGPKSGTNGQAHKPARFAGQRNGP